MGAVTGRKIELSGINVFFKFFTCVAKSCNMKVVEGLVQHNFVVEIFVPVLKEVWFLPFFYDLTSGAHLSVLSLVSMCVHRTTLNQIL